MLTVMNIKMTNINSTKRRKKRLVSKIGWEYVSGTNTNKTHTFDKKEGRKSRNKILFLALRTNSQPIYRKLQEIL